MMLVAYNIYLSYSNLPWVINKNIAYFGKKMAYINVAIFY